MNSDFLNRLETNRLETNRLETNSLETEFQQIIHARHKAAAPASKRAALFSRQRWGQAIVNLFSRQRWGQAIVNFLTGQQTLSVRKKQQRGRSPQWIVYDPINRKRYVFNSDSDVRAWLEQRYHQKAPRQ